MIFCASGKSTFTEKLEEELNHLKEVKRPEVIKALKDARALGDLSENNFL